MHAFEDNITSISLLRSHDANATLNEAPTVPAAGTYTGATVDTKGEAEKLEVFLNVVFKRSTNTIRLLIEESEDNSTFTTLTTFTDVSATGRVTVDLTPAKRYIRASATLGSTGTAYLVFCVDGLFYNRRYAPSNIALA